MKPETSPNEESATRRTEGVRRRGRSARVVEAVLEAAAEELGRVGFEQLRVEDVAQRAGVNKTTVYRRWPTKAELVHAAVSRLTEEPLVPDTGALRDDMRQLLSRIVEVVSTLRGRGVLRMLQTQKLNPEFAGVVDGVRREHRQARATIFERAMARGEIPLHSDALLLTELLVAPLMARLLHFDEPADARFLDALVDTVLAGATAGSAPRSPRPRR